MKKAAALLLNGGTLTSEQCDACGSPQVRFKGNLVCINCGKGQEQNSSTATGKDSKIRSNSEQARIVQSQQIDQRSSPLFAAKADLEEKVRMLVSESREEHDINKLKEQAEVISLYVEIIVKIQSLTKL